MKHRRVEDPGAQVPRTALRGTDTTMHSWLSSRVQRTWGLGISHRCPGEALLIRDPSPYNKDCYLSAYYRRIAARRGRQWALIAVMHKLAITIWHILRNKTAARTSGPTTSPDQPPNVPCAG
ncbi:hypothetical protein [Streptomyces sp. SLBN-8D4]|jgi:hypothetical protein|uniref:hypothetical protein n=1 Tax=Streptomyces sp. SLBN-8D4 TaxID=3377728 RepID=UPI003C7BB114